MDLNILGKRLNQLKDVFGGKKKQKETILSDVICPIKVVEKDKTYGSTYVSEDMVRISSDAIWFWDNYPVNSCKQKTEDYHVSDYALNSCRIGENCLMDSGVDNFFYHSPLDAVVSVPLEITLDLSKFLSTFKNISELKQFNSKDYVVRFGCYPQKLSHCFDLYFLLRYGNGFTGKKYIGRALSDGKFMRNSELKYNTNKYVSMKNPNYAKEKRNSHYNVFDVQTVKWKVLNWDEMPTCINPNGTGVADKIYLRSIEGLLSGIPYSFNCNGECEQYFWKDSPMRSALNGFNRVVDKNVFLRSEGIVREMFNYAPAEFINLCRQEDEELMAYKWLKHAKHEIISDNVEYQDHPFGYDEAVDGYEI